MASQAAAPSIDWAVVHPPSVPEIVTDRLREAILAGQIKPGERLVERTWAARFGIGQPTLREALRELELQGFVRKSPMRGTYVTELSLEECRKLLEVRMALEALAIQRALPRLTPENLREIAASLEELEAAARELDQASFHESDMRFHQCIWGLVENEHLTRVLEQVAFRLFAFLKMRPATGAHYLAAAAQHREIFEGLRSGDPAIAIAAFTRSTLKFWREQGGVEIGVFW